jgi:hypothetical protein
MVSKAKFLLNFLPLYPRFAPDCLLKGLGPPRRHLMLDLGHRRVASAKASLPASPVVAEAVFEPLQHHKNM